VIFKVNKDFWPARRGDRRAAEQLVLASYESVFNYLYRLCRDRADAEDLTQETYARVWDTLGGYEGRCSFKTWVHRIAYHLFIDRTRRKSLPRTVSEWWDGGTDTQPGPAEHAAEKQEAQRLYRLVEGLNEEQRQVIHLRYYQGLSLRDTAFVSEAALSTVKYRLRTALDILKERMSKNDENKLKLKPSGEKNEAE